MAICKKCVLTIMDGRTTCELCEGYVHPKVDWQKKEVDFKNLIDRYRGVGDQYDFIVPLTGGKDSTYVLYYLTKIIKEARVLAYTCDNYLIRKASWENIRKAIKATCVDYKIGRWDYEKTIKVFRATFLHTAKICYCYHYLNLSILPFAISQKIPLIVTGFSAGQRELNYAFKMPDQIKQKQDFIAFYNMFKKLLSESLNHHEPDATNDILHHFFSDYDKYVQPEANVEFYPVMVPLSNYVNWMNLDNLKNLLRETMNWQQSAASISHTSCMIEPIKGYLENKKNLQEMSSELSNLIRAGYMSREQAIQDMRLMHMDGQRPEILSEFCKFIHITEDDFDKTVKTRSIPAHLISPLLESVAWQFGIDKFNTPLV